MALSNGSAPKEPDDEPRDGLIALVKSFLLKPFHIVLSKTALRAYLTTFLAVATAIVLFGFAVTAYILFYWSYIPRIGFERTVHLQFDNVYSHDHAGASGVSERTHPHGVVTLWPDLVGAQRYDILVELHFPRTPSNTAEGNFMLLTTLHAPPSPPNSGAQPAIGAATSPGSDKVLASSRRPAILPYRSPLLDLSHTLTHLPLSLLFPLNAETSVLRIPMFEALEFPAKNWRAVPSTLRLEIQSEGQMQVYGAKVVFRARFAGLRWVMYNWWGLSGVVFIGGFWAVEMLAAGVAWGVIGLVLAGQAGSAGEDGTEGGGKATRRIKEEGEGEEDGVAEMSDTERTFPGVGGGPAVKYEPELRIKKEEEEADEEMGVVVPEHEVKASQADAEDEEDEDADFFLDSGLGTSMESGNASRRDSMRRRRGRVGVREKD
ncbi:hypothetical protein LTR48_006788 [Friedmanniomyces endolithicus]|uniref:Seipin n=1 Tax=Rachicladosporium monterosium TaxID=1507873 RepID=A0ABR0KXX4_9PEZI|nr:hypothetical protein LTR29_013280 [Friedmanniomyces endolithicus]KAK1091198.1 hypothetical protein LTR48_006788 [Friedmanniomyces endolithicus]KAK5140407.1 hypothetical protein LTR32_006780 [Rachicladosporium monterosium]